MRARLERSETIVEVQKNLTTAWVERKRAAVGEVIQEVEALGKQIGIRAACQVVGVLRSRVYRVRQGPQAFSQRRLPSPRPLSIVEQEEIRQTLNSPRFADCAPREVWASLLDE